MQLFSREKKTYYNCLVGFEALEDRTPIGQRMHSFRSVQFLVRDRWYEPQNHCFFLWIGCRGKGINKCCRNMNAIKDGCSASHDDSADVLLRQALQTRFHAFIIIAVEGCDCFCDDLCFGILV